MRYNRQRVASRFIQIERGHEILGEVHVLAFEHSTHNLRRILRELQRVSFRRRLKVGQSMRGPQFEIDSEMVRHLCMVCIRAQRNREIRFEILDRNRLVVFEFQTLRPISRNRNNPRTENGAALSFLGATLSHLKQPRINGLLLQFVINLAGALALQDHSRNAHRAVPHGKIGNCRPARQCENVVPFLNAGRMVGEDLAHKHASIAIVNLNGNFHLLERKNRGIRLGLVLWNQYAAIRESRRGRQ